MEIHFLFLTIGLCISTHVIPLEPRSEAYFFEEVKEDGLQFKLKVDVNTQANVVFRVYEPHELYKRESINSKDFEKFHLRKDYFYDKKGFYKVRVVNLDSLPVLVIVRSVVDKPYTAEDDFSEIKRSLQELSDALSSTYTANMQLRSTKEEHRMEAKRMLWKMMLLFFFSFGYAGIGFWKSRKMKKFFQPNK